jgi:universal stress protein E
MIEQGTERIELEIPAFLEMSRNSATRKRLLCATDLSPRSQLAVGRAMHLAKRLDAEVILLHVIDPVEFTQGRMYARDEIVRQLDSIRVTTRREPQIQVRTGDYVEGIAAVAKETDADVILLGAQRPKALAPLIGTTAERVIALADRPALIVNIPSHLRYDAVVIAAELSDAVVQVVRVASSLKFLDAVNVSMVHGLDFPRGPLSLLDAHAAKRGLEAWENAAKTRLLRKLDIAGVESSRIGIVLYQARPVQAIRRVIRSIKPELLIVGTKDRSIFKRVLSGSAANDVLGRVRCDILVAAPNAERKTRLLDRNTSAYEITAGRSAYCENAVS